MKYLPQIKSRVSRRIFLAVLLCAIIPISGLILLTLQNVRSNLEADTARRLHHAGKNIGMAMVAEFVSIDKALRKVATLYQVPETGLEMAGDAWIFGEDVLERFWLLTPRSNSSIAGLAFSEQYNERLAQGVPQLIVARMNQKVQLFLCSLARDAADKLVTAVGQIKISYLEEYAGNLLPANAQLAVLDTDWQPLVGEPIVRVGPELFQAKSSGGHHYVEVNNAGEAWIGGRWNLFLQAAFNAPDWNVLVFEPKEAIFSNFDHFGRNAWLTSAIAFWVILLVSSILIRKTLQPLQQLKEATQQIAQGQFDCQVQLASRDEFEELATSFNQMTGKIRQQVDQQQNMGEAVRQILGPIDADAIIVNFLHTLDLFESVDMLSLTLLSCPGKSAATIWLSKTGAAGAIERLPNVPVGADEVEELLQTGEASFVQQWRYPTLLQPLAERGGQLFSLLTTEFKPSMFALVGFSHVGERAEQTDVLIAKQLLEQLGVALSRAEMVKELDDLNLGILTALARTVDANSRWTRGHSERVTQYAVGIAKVMGLAEADCQSLHQAGLLHDLGKVAVPAEILNKPGALTEAEFEVIRKHPVEAARIIEPIQVFGEILPIVRQHHERWDGSGYPDGLRETEIHLGARILAVSDVYDALYSERPYRSGWSQDKVLRYLQEQAGKSFDPEVVKVLCAMAVDNHPGLRVAS